MKTITLGEVISPAKTVRCGNGNYPVLSMTMHDGIVLQSERFSKNLASNDTSNYKVVCAGQLVVGFPIDEGVLYVQRCVSSGIMSPAYNVWDIDTGVIDDEYLELILHSPKAMQYYKDNLRGSTARRRSLPNSTLLAFEFNLPAITVQKEYVDLIKKQNELIGIKKQQLNSFDELVKSRFIEMFGDYKINDKGFDCKKGSELFKFSSGKFLPEEKRLETGVPVYGGNGIAWYTEESLIDYPTVIIGRVGAQCGNIHSVTTPVGITDNAIYIKEQKTMAYTLEFLSELMRMMNFYQYADFSGQPKITQKPLETLDYIMPPVELQREYTAFVEQTDKLKFDGIKIINLFEILKIKSWRRES